VRRPTSRALGQGRLSQFDSSGALAVSGAAHPGRRHGPTDRRRHPFRRKWAMERKGLELRGVAYAGGWKEPTTLLKVYQKPDPETLERVVVQRRTLREA